MKCPGCEHDAKKKERDEKGGACPSCGRKFRLDPPTPLSDYAIETCLRRLSDGGKHKLSRAQLVCEVERLLLRKSRRAARITAYVVGIAGVVTALVIVVHGRTPLVGLLVLLVLLSIAALLFWMRPSSAPQASAVVARYLAAGPPLPLVIEHQPQTSPRRLLHRELDLQSYGFDRVVLVDDPAIVDVLVANNFHFEHNAAIVSMSRYPAHVADLVEKQLAETDAVKVYVLHDASLEAFAAASQFLASGFAGRAPVVRLGLWPKTVAHIRPRRPATTAPVTGLSPDVARALASESVSLSALRPAQLMTLLFNGFHQTDAGGLVIVSDYGTPIDVVYDFG